ncbi:MAG: hypothetical protein NC217_06845 [Muribaculaceae bacterium]|nr:hypothetical protein [Muribaculaceae bacterium]
MKKYILTLISVLALGLSGMASTTTDKSITGRWDIHNTYFRHFSESIDTQDRVYLVAAGHYFNANLSYWKRWGVMHGQLFVLDKKTEQLTGYDASNYLTKSSIVMDIAYNAAKGYLFILYEDLSIDLLYNDNTVKNIKGLSTNIVGREPAMGGNENVNSVTFDPERDKIYIATKLGYVVIDDAKESIVETHLLNKSIAGVSRVGNDVILTANDGIFVSKIENRNISITEFSKVSDAKANFIMPLKDSKFAYTTDKGLFVGSIDNGVLTSTQKDNAAIAYYAENKDGYFLRRTGCAYQLDKEGNVNKRFIDKTAISSLICSSWDMKDFYAPVVLEGIQRLTMTGDNTSTGSKMFAPNAPRTYATVKFDYSPEYGMIASHNSYNRFYASATLQCFNTISGYNDNQWKHYGNFDIVTPVGRLLDTYHTVVDPDGEYIWGGSMRNGVFRIKLSDLTANVYGNKNTKCESYGHQGYYDNVFPNSSHSTYLCNVSTPSFDAYGNLWCIFLSSSSPEPNQPVFCWPKEARDKNDVSAFKKVPVNGADGSGDFYHCMATKVKKGFVMFAAGYNYGAPVQMLYHAGTIDDTSDDKFFSYSKFVDQNNVCIPLIYNDGFFEDPTTGNIWIFLDNGTFYFNPEEALAAGDTNGVLRVKRATYEGRTLFDGTDVLCAATDNQGRLWFGTNGMGIYVVTPKYNAADKDAVMEVESVYQITTDNSLIASDMIYGMGYDPNANAMWIGTSEQVCTFYIDGEAPAGDDSAILAFPNPVRPEYQGNVTIQGLRKSVPVSIVDASGNEVKYLGKTTNGATVWDLTDAEGKAVKAGVYYISNSKDADPSTATRIQVVR